MSQIFKPTQGSGPVPTPITFVTDVNSPAVTSASVLTTRGDWTTDFYFPCIRTDGDSGGSHFAVELTNIFGGAVGTVGNTPQPVFSQNLGFVAGTYFIRGSITSYDRTDLIGASYEYTLCVRTTGAAATIIGSQLINSFIEGAMVSTVVAFTVVGNNLVLTVTGLSGKTIAWDTYFNYRFAS
jgi:hypothetical protein